MAGTREKWRMCEAAARLNNLAEGSEVTFDPPQKRRPKTPNKHLKTKVNTTRIRRYEHLSAISLGSLLLGSAALSAVAQVPATNAASAQAPTPSAAKPAVASPSLVNDWLRQQSPAFKSWDIGGQFQLRYELKDNAGSFPNRDFIAQVQDNSNDYLMERLRYHLGYTPASWFTAFVEGRNSLEQRDKRMPSLDIDSVNLRQAFVAFGDAKQFPLLAKVGRQELLYGEERFVGIADWNNIGRTFDAAKLRYESSDFWLDAFAGRMVIPYEGHFNVANDYDWLFGLYGSTPKLIPWQETQLYFLSRNVGKNAPNAIAPGLPGTPTTARDIYTYGTRWASLPGKLGGWDYSLEAAGQFGSINQSNVRRDQESYAVFASGGYTWKKAWGSPRLGLGYELAPAIAIQTTARTRRSRTCSARTTVSMARLLHHHPAAGSTRRVRRHAAGLRAGAGRIRRHEYGRRQHAWPDHHALRGDLPARPAWGRRPRLGAGRRGGVAGVSCGGGERVVTTPTQAMNTGLTASFAKRFAAGPVIRVDDLSASGKAGITVLFGASGSGKTTVLRCLAGLERPDEGSIRFGDQVWSDAGQSIFLPPRERNIGFVPQDYALFPHLTVERNIAYGLDKLASGERQQRVAETLDWLGLAGLEKRLPRELSGGQQQRVALARAVVRRPHLLFLDEPLAALDTPTRLRLRGELRQRLTELNIPTILVTHDRTEALALGDDVVVMVEGAIAQHGQVPEVFSQPANLAVAGIVGMETVHPGRVRSVTDGLATIAMGTAQLTALARDLPAGTEEVYACIRAEDVVLAQDETFHPSSRNRLPAIVRSIHREGPLARVELDCGFPLSALLTWQSCEELALGESTRVLALIKAPQIHLLPRAGGPRA